ncbi:MAG TPA: YcxB family protein [Terriglobales bacterium]|nr:YcxB family protein [Terriglobales bacterium]
MLSAIFQVLTAPIKIEYRYDSGDVDEAFRSVRSRAWKKARARLLLVTALLLLCFATFYWLDPISPTMFLLLGVCLGVLALVLSAWLRAKGQTRGIWKAYPVLQYKFTAEIDSDCIKTTCDIAFSMRRWECFTGYYESANLFHLQEGSRVFWIPKRAFAGEAEINQMRELLRSKLSCTTE